MRPELPKILDSALNSIGDELSLTIKEKFAKLPNTSNICYTSFLYNWLHYIVLITFDCGLEL